jgi:glycerol-3-phosphate dehydrogenase
LDRSVDLLIIGGGINGCGIARDAAGRGWSVLLCEMGDLASATSSWSSKLIHGGLRYLEYYEFRLVREALMEREVLWRIAPHIITPLRLVLPYRKGLRPAWILRTGLFLYDHIGGRKLLPATKVLDLAKDRTGKPLKSDIFTKGFEYSDARVDDARLVVLNARDAADRGAEIRTRTKVVGARRGADTWTVQLRNERTGRLETVTARAVVNAAGPWVADVLTGTLGLESRAHTRLVQGSHIVVRKLYEHDRAYILQNGDGRIVFVIPYEGDFTLIGTTDRDYTGDPSKVRATTDEIDYLCKAVSEDFARPVTPNDVVWSYSGVRPLYDDGASEAKAATRDYVLEMDAEAGKPAVLSVFGGKITTYRRLTEEALQKLSAQLPQAAVSKGWTAEKPLPGGDFAVDGARALERDLAKAYPFLEPAHVRRLVRSYGTRAKVWLGNATRKQDLGLDFGATLTETEVRYLVSQEWAETAEDVVWRRSKLGLRMSPAEIAALDGWMHTGMGAGASQARTAP